MRKTKQKGQTLVELIVVIAVVIIVVGALTFATIASIRNARFSTNYAQATKLAQEGLERVRSGRDRNNLISGSFTLGSGTVDNWQDPDLWSNSISANCIPVCYFKLKNPPSIPGEIEFIGTSTLLAEQISSFKRSIVLSDTALSFSVEKIVTATVSWTDFSGTHESRLTTILRKQ